MGRGRSERRRDSVGLWGVRAAALEAMALEAMALEVMEAMEVRMEVEAMEWVEREVTEDHMEVPVEREDHVEAMEAVEAKDAVPYGRRVRDPVENMWESQ